MDTNTYLYWMQCVLKVLDKVLMEVHCPCKRSVQQKQVISIKANSVDDKHSRSSINWGNYKNSPIEKKAKQNTSHHGFKVMKKMAGICSQ